MDRTKICGLSASGHGARPRAGCGLEKTEAAWSDRKISRNRWCWAKSSRSIWSTAWAARCTRQFNLGGTLLTYQALLNGQIRPLSGVHRHHRGRNFEGDAASDPAQAFERSRLEMPRIAQIEVLNPLGIDKSSPW